MSLFVRLALGIVLWSAAASAAEPVVPKAAPAVQKAEPVDPKAAPVVPKVEPVVPKAETVVLKVVKAQSSLEYRISHPFHDAVGRSQEADGGVRILPGGTIAVAVSAKVSSFDSQNSSRDVKMQEKLESSKYQQVVFTGTSTFAMPTAFPTTLKLNVEGNLDFHGRKKKETVPIQVTFSSPTEAHAVGKFTVSLDKYEVDRPSLMLMKIDDACQIALDLLLKQ